MTRDEKSGNSFPASARVVLGGISVAVFTSLLFSPAVGFDFVHLDDRTQYLENDHWRGLTAESLAWMWSESFHGHYHPLTWLSVAIDDAARGPREDGSPDPHGLHATNVAFHAWNAGWVFVVLAMLRRRATGRELDRGETAAVFAAACFYAWHPLRVESVAWVSERRDVLSLAFLLPAVAAYLRSCERPRPANGWFVATVVLFVLSLLSKAWGITLPVVLLIVDYYPLRRIGPAAKSGLLRVAAEKGLLLAIAVPFAVWAAAAQRAAGAVRDLNFDIVERFLVAADAVWWYLYATLLPVSHHPFRIQYSGEELYALRWPLAGGAAALIALTAAVTWLGRRLPAVAAGWWAFLVIVAPVSGLSQSGFQSTADRYLYVAAIPLSAVLAGGLAGATRRGPLVGTAAVAAGVAAAVWGGWRTQELLPVWRSADTLVAHAAEVAPENPFVLLTAGVRAREAGGADEAEPLLADAAERARERGEWLFLRTASKELVRLYAARGEAETAHKVLKKLLSEVDDLEAMKMLPALGADEPVGLPPRRLEGIASAGRDDPDLLRAVGRELLLQGEPGRARGALRRAVELRPGDSSGYLLYGYAVAGAGEAEEAAAVYRRAAAVLAAEGAAPTGLIAVVAEWNAPRARAVVLGEVAARFPNSFEAQFAAGEGYAAVGESARAADAFERAAAVADSDGRRSRAEERAASVRAGGR